MKVEGYIENENNSFTLDEQQTLTIPEGRYSFLLSGLDRSKTYDVRLLNHHYVVKNKSAFHTLIDTINHIGYINITVTDGVNEVTFIIYSTTYKVNKEHLYQMVNFLGQSILSANNQFIYYDKKTEAKQVIYHPLFLYNWIDNHLEEIERIIFKINATPYQSLDYKAERVRPIGEYNKQKSLSFLRNDRSRLISSENGILSNSLGSFYVNEVIRATKIASFETNEHLQIVELIYAMNMFIEGFAQLASDFISKQQLKKLLLSIEEKQWSKRLLFLKHETFLKHINTNRIKYVKRFPISPIQRSNNWYRRMYQIYSDFITNFFIFSDQNKINNQIQSIMNMDDIYEAFCCYTIADILDLKDGELIPYGLSFYNDEIEMFYQSKPDELQGWGVDDIPDIVLKRRNGKILLSDCKFKITETTGDVKGVDIQKVQGYMNNYNQRTAAIFYPSADTKIITVNDDLYGNRLLKIPIFPLDKNEYTNYKKDVAKAIMQLL
jgi:hypothetical protein